MIEVVSRRVNWQDGTKLWILLIGHDKPHMHCIMKHQAMPRFSSVGVKKKGLVSKYGFSDEINYITLIDRLSTTAFPAHKFWPCDVSLQNLALDKLVAGYIPHYHMRNYCPCSEVAFKIILVFSILQIYFFIALMPIDGLKELGSGFESWYWSNG